MYTVGFLVCFLSYYLIKYYNDIDSVSNLRKYSLFMGIICGFSLAIKVNTVCYTIIPLIILPGIKIKGRFIAVTLVSFLFFGFTTLYNLNYFSTWIWNLFIHKGHYGSGPKGIIDFQSFIDRLTKIFLANKVFFIMLVIGLLAILLQLMPKRKDQKLLLITISIFLSIVFHTLLVTKHFSLNYMLPAIFLFSVTVYFFIECISKYYYQIKSYLYLACIILIGFFFIRDYQRMLPWRREAAHVEEEVVHQVRATVEGKKFIIVPQSSHTIFKEQGLIFGTMYTGIYRARFSEALEKIYPEVFLYNDIGDNFLFAARIFPNDKILSSGEEAYIFFVSKQIAYKTHILSLLGNNLSIDSLYTHPKSGDFLCRVRKF